MESPIAPKPANLPSGENDWRVRPILILGVSISVIAVTATLFYFFYYRSAANSSEIPVTKVSTEIQDPVGFFYTNFSLKNYRVRISGKDEAKYSFYYEKGTLVRIDGEGTYDSEKSTIIKNGKLYSIDNEKKVFVEMDLDNPQSTYILTLYKAGALLDPILQGETPNASPWILVRQDPKNAKLSEYQANGRKFMPLLPGSMDLVDIKILLNTDNGLIESASIKAPKDADWNWVHFQYEEVNDIESVKKFPMDYRKVDPI